MRLPYQHDQHDAATRDATDRRLGRVVVGVDFTESSLAVAQWVGRHLAPSTELALVHVTPMALMPNVSRVGSNRLAILDGRPSDRVQSLRGALRGLASLISVTRTTVEVRVGDPATQLAVYADGVDADLVVVAASTRYHIAPRYETATTHQLLRRVSRPVLIARNAHAAPTTVLAVVADGSDASPVLAAARMVAMTCAARVTRLDVTAEPAIRSIVDAARELRADIVAVGTHAPAGEIMRDDGHAAADALVRTTGSSVLVVPQSTNALLPPPRLWPRR